MILAAVGSINTIMNPTIILVLVANFIPQYLVAADNNTLPLIFIFGDSTADVGTNNYLNHSQARANFKYNGIDFPHSRPTGRFSNGFNSADSLAKQFGLNRSPPPFLFLCALNSTHQFRQHLYGGVNFASGGSGLLDLTGANLTVVPLSQQIAQFTTVRDNFTAMIGPNAADALLSKGLFFISVGGNDIFDYFNTTERRMSPDDFISTLMSAYSNHIITLYELGARRFGIISVAPVGCCPSQRLVQKLINGTDGCFGDMNDVAHAFHAALDRLLSNITTQLPHMKYALGNAINMTLDVIKNPGFFKFKNVDTACCGHGTNFNAEGPCNGTASLCPDRRKYLFWDLFHPTQKAASVAAGILYGGPTYYVSPITFSQLAEDN